MNGGFFLFNSGAVRDEDDAAEGQDADDSGFHNIGFSIFLAGSICFLFVGIQVPDRMTLVSDVLLSFGRRFDDCYLFVVVVVVVVLFFSIRGSGAGAGATVDCLTMTLVAMSVSPTFV